MIKKKDFSALLRTPKTLPGSYDFKANRKAATPKFLGLNNRVKVTEQLNLGEGFILIMAIKDDPLPIKRHFNAWLLLDVDDGFEPIARLDYHCSHKGIHIHVNCEDDRILTNRALPGVKYLNLKTVRALDPAQPRDQETLVKETFRVYNIGYPKTEGLFQ